MKTNVTKAWLIATVAKNRAGHREEFEAAWKKFQEKAIEQMTKNLAAAKANKAFQLYVNLTQPQDMTSAYDRVLGMLEREEGHTIELSEADWEKYVQDTWDWTDQFKTSTATYLAAD